MMRIEVPFRVGDYVTIKSEYNTVEYMKWYHTEPMKILGITQSDWIILYKLEYKFENLYYIIPDGSIVNDHISPNRVELSKSHIRHDKLEKILN